MKERVVNFKTAKLAKEKGFNAPVRSMYLDNELFLDKNTKGNFNDPKWVSSWRTSPTHDTLSAPTQSLLQRWLREIHKIECYAYPYKDHAADNNDQFEYRGYRSKMKLYNTFEEALENDLQEGLKLIPDKHEKT